MPPALALIVWKKYNLTLCVWNAYALALVLRKLACRGRSCLDTIYLDTHCQPGRLMRYASSSSTHTHGPPRTSHCERHVRRSAQQANALTLVLKKNIRRLEERRTGTHRPEGICRVRCRPDATCRDIRRLEEICPDTLCLEEKVPWHSSSRMQIPWQVLSRRHCHEPGATGSLVPAPVPLSPLPCYSLPSSPRPQPRLSSALREAPRPIPVISLQ